MRIHIPMGITAAALAFALAACASPQPAPSVPGAESQPPTTAAPAEPVQLTLWTGFTGGDRGAYEDLIKTFNQTHTSIQVTMEIQPWDTIAQKLPAAWATGQGPDLATPNFDPNILAEYLRTNSLLAFDQVGTGEGQIDSAALAPATMDAFTIDGKLYAVPANIATLQLYYNKALLPEPPTTVDEFRELAKSTTADGVYGLSVGERETIQMWPILQWLDGADVVDENNCSLLDSPESIASLTTWAQLALDGAMPVGLTGGESDSVFSAGKAAMQLNGPWAAPGYLDAGIDLGIAPVPEGVDGMVTLASTVPLAISAKTQHPKEAQEFLAWWVGKDAQKQFALASGFPPVRTDLSDDPELAANDVVAKFAAALPGARLWLYGVPNAAKIDSEVYVTLIAEITRGTDVATAAKTASEKLNALSGCSK
jgi:ABC-type glycerol-3-phosphate transport system substrate-binding protein